MVRYLSEQSTWERRKSLVYLAAAVAVSMALVLAFADDSDYRAMLAARTQKLSDDLKFDSGINIISVLLCFSKDLTNLNFGIAARDLFGENPRDWNRAESFEVPDDADTGIATR